MKKLIGHDIQNGAILGSYAFSPSTNKVTIIGMPNLAQEQILLITDTTAGVIIYNFASATFNGTILNNVITLDYNCTALSTTDTLQIYVDIPDTAPADTAMMMDSYTHLLLERIVEQLSCLTTQDGQQRQRVTVDNITGSLTLGTITTVGTVNTLSAITAGPVIGSGFYSRLTDGVSMAAVKAASTVPAFADPAVVVTLSPNQIEWSQIEWARQSYDTLRSKLTVGN